MTTLSRRDTFRFGAALAATSTGLHAVTPLADAASVAPLPVALVLPTRPIQGIVLSVRMADARDSFVAGVWPGHAVIDATRFAYPRQRGMVIERPETVDLVEAAVQRLIAEVTQEIPLSTLTTPDYLAHRAH